jgi:hypothetical protein
MKKHKKDMISENDFTLLTKDKKRPILSGGENEEFGETLLGMEYDVESDEEIKATLNEVNDDDEIEKVTHFTSKH